MNELFSNDFINLEDAIDELCENCFMQNCSHDCDVIKSLRKVIAADVRPVIKAHWIETAPINRETMKPLIVKGPHLKCSNCGSIEFQRNYCPNCGAEMEKINNEN